MFDGCGELDSRQRAPRLLCGGCWDVWSGQTGCGDVVLGDNMSAVTEEQRVAELRRFRLSEPLIRLASGDCVHPEFRDSCLGPPFFTYNGAGMPEGPMLVPLWDHGDKVVGVWERPEGLEFIEFGIEATDEYTVLARTEQGFWAVEFDFLYEFDVSLTQLRQAATAIGFRFMEKHLASREAAEERLGSFEEHDAWLRDLVAEIDREMTGA